MRKLIIFLVTGILWCNVGFAAKEKPLLKEYINDGKIYKGMTKIQLKKVTKSGFSNKKN